jgi:hypothetical protein
MGSNARAAVRIAGPKIDLWVVPHAIKDECRAGFDPAGFILKKLTRHRIHHERLALQRQEALLQPSDVIALVNSTVDKDGWIQFVHQQPIFGHATNPAIPIQKRMDTHQFMMQVRRPHNRMSNFR